MTKANAQSNSLQGVLFPIIVVFHPFEVTAHANIVGRISWTVAVKRLYPTPRAIEGVV
jgi:hypothetical protein